MKQMRWIKTKRTAVMIMTAFLIINIITTNFLVIVKAESFGSNIEVTEIDMGEYSDTMKVGEKQLLSVTVLPVDATEQSITYSSTNTTVATINGMGRITAVSVGTTVITATCQGKCGSFILTVKADDANTNIPVTDIDMGEYSDTMEVGQRQLLSVTVLPTDATNQTVTYTSSNTNVAIVNTIGRITALSEGTTVITAICEGKSGFFNLTVKSASTNEVKVTELDLGDYQSEMEIGSSQVLSITPLPTDATNTTITYTSSNPSVATVNSMGRISALKIGKVAITISCGGISSYIHIKVKEKSDDTIEVTDLEIANHEEKVKIGETLSLTATVLPSNATDATVTYKSSNDKIATVSSSGEVKGISAGNVTITITAGKIIKKEKIQVIVETKAISINNNYLVLKPGDTFALTGTVAPSDAPQSLTFKSINTNIATVAASGVVTAHAVGNTSIIVSNGDMQAAVSVIVNASEMPSTEDEMSESETGGKETTINYSDVVYASEFTKIDSEMLKYLYSNTSSLLIVGDGYSISVNGKDIVNYLNELVTDIQLHSDTKLNNKSDKDTDGISFVVNNGEALCGDITLYLDGVRGKYLYLYNEAKEQYEIIESENLSELRISTAGKYLITDKKIRNDNLVVLIILIIGGLALLIGIGVYIGIKKQYWFW